MFKKGGNYVEKEKKQEILLLFAKKWRFVML